LYRFQVADRSAAGADARAADVPCAQLLASGAILREAIAAAGLLQADYGIAADIWSVTSFSELARDGMRAERAHRAALAEGRPVEPAAGCWVSRSLAGTGGPIIAATDYKRLGADSVRPWVPPGRRY